MSASLPNRARSERVLVVDDNEAGRYMKTRVLRQAGYQVAEAANGREALQRVGEDLPDLILLDVRLPDMSGLDVCRRIKTNPETAMVPVIQMSAAFRDDQSKVAGLEGGADGYVSEPIEPTLLIATIEAFLRTRRAEQAVRDLALEWQTTFDAISDGVALIDEHCRIIRSNRTLEGILNRPSSELSGAVLDQLLPSESGIADVWRDLEKEGRRRTEVVLGDRVYSLTVDPARDAHGRVHGAVCIFSDITERKLMNERLWHKQKLESIGLLAGGVAHDFNNILVGILGNASLGLESLTDPQSTDRAFRDILRASERAADLTRQLLAYAGKGKVMVQSLDLSRTIMDILPLVRALIPRKVEVLLNLSKDLPAVSADRTQVEQIIMNLLINAAEAVDEDTGQIRVTTDPRFVPVDQRQRYLSEGEVRGHYAMLEVSDNGVGMDAATLKQIFDPFYTTKFMGRGLGLSAVLGIVRGHKGAIRVSSTPSIGSNFELLFPSAEAPADFPIAVDIDAELIRSGSKGAGTILVVDDEPIVRDFFQSALEHYGYEVVLAREGSEALRIFAEQPDRFLLVLLDIVMPVMGGKETLPRLQEIRPDVPIVVTSGQMEDEARRELRDWKIAGFLQKPCSSRTLIEKVQAVTSSAAFIRPN